MRENMTMINDAELQKEVEGIIKYSQDYPFKLDASSLIADWHRAKQPYLDLFGGATYVRLTTNAIEAKPSESEQSEKFENFIERLDLDGYLRNARDGFESFLRDNKDGFFSNTVVSARPQLKILEGMKLLKTFKYYFSDIWVIRQVQDLASRLIQDTKIYGYLYLSVDPRDYLTISENNHNWRSCHALDGEFRSGNLNYMVDDTTLVAFLSDGEQEHLSCMPEGGTWFSKKWRMLIHTNAFNSVVYFNRQYPFDNDGLMNCLFNQIDRRFCKSSLCMPRRDMSFKTIKCANGHFRDLESNKFIIDDSLIIDSSKIIDATHGNGYCDLCYSPHYAPIFSYTSDSAFGKYLWGDEDSLVNAFIETCKISVGKEAKCVRCGRNNIERTDSFLCDDCIVEEDADEDFFIVCAGCGSRIYDLSEAHGEDDEYYCHTCWESMPKQQEED